MPVSFKPLEIRGRPLCNALLGGLGCDLARDGDPIVRISYRVRLCVLEFLRWRQIERVFVA